MQRDGAAGYFCAVLVQYIAAVIAPCEVQMLLPLFSAFVVYSKAHRATFGFPNKLMQFIEYQKYFSKRKHVKTFCSVIFSKLHSLLNSGDNFVIGSIVEEDSLYFTIYWCAMERKGTSIRLYWKDHWEMRRDKMDGVKKA